jgi:hypothetical protein
MLRPQGSDGWLISKFCTTNILPPWSYRPCEEPECSYTETHIKPRVPYSSEVIKWQEDDHTNVHTARPRQTWRRDSDTTREEKSGFGVARFAEGAGRQGRCKASHQRYPLSRIRCQYPTSIRANLSLMLLIRRSNGKRPMKMKMKPAMKRNVERSCR